VADGGNFVRRITPAFHLELLEQPVVERSHRPPSQCFRREWRYIAEGLVIPRIAGAGALTTIVAVLGTTISPYLFFWQSAQEVEEIDEDKRQEPLIEAPRQARF
jgi:hypothetical protein